MTYVRQEPRPTAALRSIGIREGDLGQRAVLEPLIEDGLRPRAVRAVAAVELLDEDGEDASALLRIAGWRLGWPAIGGSWVQGFR